MSRQTDMVEFIRLTALMVNGVDLQDDGVEWVDALDAATIDLPHAFDLIIAGMMIVGGVMHSSPEYLAKLLDMCLEDES